MTTTAQALVRARSIIESGWIQGEYNYEDQRFCAMGSIYHALGTSSDSTPNDLSALCGRPTKYLAAAIVQEGLSGRRKKVPAKFMSQAGLVIDFNDNAKTTKEQVLQVFDRAIGNAKRRHLNG